METFSADPLDRELGRWLRDESGVRAPAGLVENVFARTSRTPQVRRWWPTTPGRSGTRAANPSSVWPRRLGSLGAVAVVLVAVIVGFALRQPGTGPGASPTIPSASPSAEPSVEPSVELPGQRIDLGEDAGPIDVISAFDSVWVAQIHQDSVLRIDPVSQREVARIPLGSASWFAATDDALWVTSQNGTGITRLDPATNELGVHLGDVPPCGAPVIGLGSLWQAACDGDSFLQIDPAAGTLIDKIPAQGHAFLVLAAGRLITVGPQGLARLDPATKAITQIGGRAAEGTEFLASDGTTVWVKNAAGIARLDPADGRVIASFPYFDGQVVTFSGDHAWLTVSNLGILEIGLATNQVRRTIPLALSSALVAREADGVLWVTDFDGSALWRIDL